MLTIPSLERIAGRVNLRLHRGSELPPDLLLLTELQREGALECELGEADIIEDGRGRITWQWTPFVNVRLTQYPTGRLEVNGS